MSASLICVMAATTALLLLSLFLVGRRVSSEKPVEAPPAAVVTETLEPSRLPPPLPEGESLLTAHLEVGQTFHLHTRTASYKLRLIDPMTGLYDAIRTGRKEGGGVVKDPFRMLFKGTFVPNVGLRFGEFVPGGNLCYHKIRGDEVHDMSPSTPVIRILYSVREDLRQAS